VFNFFQEHVNAQVLRPNRQLERAMLTSKVFRLSNKQEWKIRNPCERNFRRKAHNKSHTPDKKNSISTGHTAHVGMHMPVVCSRNSLHKICWPGHKGGNKTCLITHKNSNKWWQPQDRQRDKAGSQICEQSFQYPKRRNERKMQMTRVTKKPFIKRQYLHCLLADNFSSFNIMRF